LFHEGSAASAFLKTEKPDAVVGFGGHGSFPVVTAARLRGIPTLVHEQNVLPGLANRLLAPVVDGVALSFSQTRLSHRRLRVTGNPIRRAIERDCRREAMRFFGFSAERRTLLVLGGSQGAESVNTLFFDAVGHLPAGLKDSMQVLHLCGRMHPEDSERRLAAAGIAAKAFSFFDRMDLAYGASDLAIGRAGATFLAEMEARRLPAVLVPYPYAGGHQLANARAVAARADAVVAEQKDLDGPKLAALMGRRFADLKTNEGGRGPIRPDPARARLADFIMETLRSR
jgi:UDP-N-acetylglucosamine--N-acetylmuramyl-(pentapeptide) pyrophosphoryl-undecaprenol N-acetylglucosamine transferase